MDRLHPVNAALAAALLLCIGGCKESEETPPTSRVNAVAAKPRPQTTVQELCDVRPEGRAFSWPELAGDPPPATQGWRWVNVWATWCKPCIEEIPEIQKWRQELAGGGKNLDIVYLSVDDSDQVVADFRRRHPAIPAGPRVAEPDTLAEWVTSLGLDPGATIPIHIFVAPGGAVRCVRTGGVGRSDYGAVEKLLGL